MAGAHDDDDPTSSSSGSGAGDTFSGELKAT